MSKIYRTIKTDVLIIGGGTAGCYAAKVLHNQSQLSLVVAEKAFVKRSGCLAAGVNALNAYIGPGETPESHTAYIKREFDDIVRDDLVYSVAKGLNDVVDELANEGLPILRNRDGSYAMRGKRSVKINGEHIKPLLADAITNKERITVIEQLQIYDLIKENNRVVGAYGFLKEENVFYRILAKATLVTTGGAAGIYKPNNPGESGHKMWYSPFNTGAGYAIGIRAGAEMTTFEMRFIALRIKNTIAPTGTIAQSLNSRHINRFGDDYLKDYDRPTTVERLLQTVIENKEGRGPCYLETEGISEAVERDLYKAYLNMAPSQTLSWIESGVGPSKANVEIEGTEPYSVGGHGASGYWVDSLRRTTLSGLYAAGDVCGGSPKKYVTGCLVEAKIASAAIIEDIETGKLQGAESSSDKWPLTESFGDQDDGADLMILESEMQSIMDKYAGGITTFYEYTIQGLEEAAARIDKLLDKALSIKVSSTKRLGELYEIIDRLYVAKVIIRHLSARKETRWSCYQQNGDYPAKDDCQRHFINSVYEPSGIRILTRALVGKEQTYEHSYQ